MLLITRIQKILVDFKSVCCWDLQMRPSTYYVITFSQTFDTPSPLCNQASLLSNSPLIIMSILCDPPLPFSLTKCITAVFLQPDFPDNLKKHKTKMIRKNNILFKPKYDFKNKKSVYLSWFDLFASIQLSFLHMSLYYL